MFAFYNPNSKNINFIEANQSGVITTNHGIPIVKTNNGGIPWRAKNPTTFLTFVYLKILYILFYVDTELY